MRSFGKSRRMARLFNHKSGNTVIVPMDHGVEGYFRELQNPEKLIASIASAGVNGFLTRPGLARFAGEAFGSAGWVQRLTGRCGIGVAINPKLDLEQLTLHDPKQALRNGADAVVPTYFFGGANEDQDLPLLGKISDTCEALGLP